MIAPQQAQRAVIGRAFIAEYVFGADGDSLPDTTGSLPDPVIVTILDAEGNTVVNAQTATVGSVQSDGTQTASYEIPAASLPERDFLTATWTTTIGGATIAQESTIDVCDARLFPLSDYNQYPEIAQRVTANKLTAADLETQRMFAEDFLERECGMAFTGRYGTETHRIQRTRSRQPWWGLGYGYGVVYQSQGVGMLALRQPYVQVIRSITRVWTEDDGPHSYGYDVEHARLDTFANTLQYEHSHEDGLWGTVVIDYEHGQPVADVRRICSLLARHRLLKGPLDDRATQLAVEGGGTVNLLTPGLLGSVTGIAEVDVFIRRYNARSFGLISS